ncbi:MAG: twin-arginine translocase TatA/TatE family subunit [Anaerolineales bacterium]|nr:twin-arginine translocase TatA/TatE family subunit [Anaerolineales bacterium]
MAGLGPTELVIILIIVIMLFGVGRISRVAGEMGSGLREFRKGLEGESPEADSDAASSQEAGS